MYRSQVQRCKPAQVKEDLEHFSFMAEMLLPVETFGKHFILFNVRGRNSTGVHIITSGYELSTAILAGLNPKPVTYQRYHIVGLGSSLMLQSDFRWLQATHPVQVVYAQMSSCFGGGSLESNMMLLTPVELFLDMYDC
uniref:IgGFc-binding protein N-terminal domain-containing protein n=1 Tax=Biomphalaria glabrata TaxID=6526 RepID=A0A2C9M7P0_BIOGL